jgi:tetratricopeptide (TPR) repeat protein
MEIAKEIACPEILWKVYSEYGNIFQSNNEYKKALDYYQKCIEVFMDVIGKIKNKFYKKSYLKRPDRQTVFTAIDIVERLM